MLSLDASEEEADVRSFSEQVQNAVGEVTYSMEPKFDGLPVEFVYFDGELDRAVTRGDGTIGDDVTANVRTIHTVPLTLHRAPETLAVRGEIYMPRSAFHEVNEQRIEEGKEPFANPRNVAAESVRLLNPTTVADRPLAVYFYDVMACSRNIVSQREAFDLMETVGLRVSTHTRFGPSIDEFVEYHDEMLEQRDTLEFDIDGVVAKVDDFGQREELGVTAAHPRWAFAYKFPAKTDETTVRKIVVQVGRTGKLTPVALLDPVDVTGVTISRATLHNERIAQERGVARGATVRVKRAGDVIPEIAEVIESPAGTFEMPDKCPVCGSDVVREGEDHFCTGGMSCPAQASRAIQHFCSPEAMGIEGIGKKLANQLVQEGVVESGADLYDPEEKDLLELENFGPRSESKLLEEIEASKDVDLARFIHALGIRHVGKARARMLAERFFLDELLDTSIDELQATEGIGPEVAASIQAFFENEANRQVIQRLLDAGVQPKRRASKREFESLTLVFSGRLEGFSREEISDLMERHGADVTSPVSSETDYIVVGENPGSTKIEAAERFDIPTLDAEEFKRQLLSKTLQ